MQGEPEAQLRRRAKRLKYVLGLNWKRREPGLYWLGWKLQGQDARYYYSTGYTLEEIQAILASEHGDIPCDVMRRHGVTVMHDGVEVERIGGGVHTRLVAMPLDFSPN